MDWKSSLRNEFPLACSLFFVVVVVCLFVCLFVCFFHSPVIERIKTSSTRLPVTEISTTYRL